MQGTLHMHIQNLEVKEDLMQGIHGTLKTATYHDLDQTFMPNIKREIRETNFERIHIHIQTKSTVVVFSFEQLVQTWNCYVLHSA